MNDLERATRDDFQVLARYWRKHPANSYSRAETAFNELMGLQDEPGTNYRRFAMFVACLLNADQLLNGLEETELRRLINEQG